MKVHAEMTDTFGGEANYSWVNRVSFDYEPNMSDRKLVLEAKKLLGITGVKCKRTDFGETIVLDPVGACVRVFIDVVDDDELIDLDTIYSSAWDTLYEYV